MCLATASREPALFTHSLPPGSSLLVSSEIRPCRGSSCGAARLVQCPRCEAAPMHENLWLLFLPGVAWLLGAKVTAAPFDLRVPLSRWLTPGLYFLRPCSFPYRSTPLSLLPSAMQFPKPQHTLVLTSFTVSITAAHPGPYFLQPCRFSHCRTLGVEWLCRVAMAALK